jgi:lipopolysaccharide/colanic/teichoic acid biosynthesis glycosyltransferase
MLYGLNPYLDRRVDQDGSVEETPKSILAMAEKRMAGSKSYRRWMKRCFVVFITLMVLPLYLPLMLIIAALVSIDEGRVLFRAPKR